MKPITPSEVKKTKKVKLPPLVYEVFNDLIEKHWDPRNKKSSFEQKTVVEALVERMVKEEPSLVGTDAAKKDLCRNKLFKEKYLNIESDYAKSGWKVSYDAPGFNEVPYEPTFTFKPQNHD